MTRAKRTYGPVKETTLVVGGLLIRGPAAPYCDCTHPAMGFTKRHDGAWVRPCCMRRTQQMFDKFGDGPIPANRRDQA